jgi:hypothetical protein
MSPTEIYPASALADSPIPRSFFCDGAIQMTNETVLYTFNKKNGVSYEKRAEVLDLFSQMAETPVQTLLSASIAAMNQDMTPAWISRKPKRPDISYGPIPTRTDGHFDIIGIGGMFAYLNLLYYASRRKGRHCIVTNPNSIFTSAAWTLHPEEDMDQRLVPMFRTRQLMTNEVLRIFHRNRKPDHPRYRAFKIDYPGALQTLIRNPGEFLKLLKVNLQYIAGEFSRVENRFARINLERNRATIHALEQMGRIGENPDHHILNLTGRIVFELPDEKTLPIKKRLKAEYDLEGRRLSAQQVIERYGTRLGILEQLNNGRQNAVFYKGGYFWAGHRENALDAARDMGAEVYADAAATRIVIDAKSGKSAVTVRYGTREKTVTARAVLLAAGDYGRDIIPVDGVSTLFAIQTDNSKYRLFPTGIGEGGTVHIVPVASISVREKNVTQYLHLGKATNGAVVGRNSRMPKRVYPDRDLLLHLEHNLKEILPPDGQLIWLTFTACARPVVSGQGYRLDRYPRGAPICFEACGGCGLGGNTSIMPEVQKALERILTTER